MTPPFGRQKRGAKAARHVQKVVLGEVRRSCGQDPSRQNLSLRRFTLSYKVFEGGGGLVTSGSLRTSGAGFAQTEAARRGIEQFAEESGGTLVAAADLSRRPKVSTGRGRHLDGPAAYPSLELYPRHNQEIPGGRHDVE